VLAKLRSRVPGRRADRRQQLGAGRCGRRRRGGLGRYARAEGKKPLARMVAAAVVGVPPEIMGIGPAPAIQLLLERAGLKLDDIGRFEINEAQGAQTLAVGRELGLDLSKLNVNGGAIALGHPLAATGVRLTITLARETAARRPALRRLQRLHRRRPGHRPAAGEPGRSLMVRRSDFKSKLA
jgi:acetyl-CoA acetyltransferase